MPLHPIEVAAGKAAALATRATRDSFQDGISGKWRHHVFVVGMPYPADTDPTARGLGRTCALFSLPKGYAGLANEGDQAALNLLAAAADAAARTEWARLHLEAAIRAGVRRANPPYGTGTTDA